MRCEHFTQIDGGGGELHVLGADDDDVGAGPGEGDDAVGAGPGDVAVDDVDGHGVGVAVLGASLPLVPLLLAPSIHAQPSCGLH